MWLVSATVIRDVTELDLVWTVVVILMVIFPAVWLSWASRCGTEFDVLDHLVSLHLVALPVRRRGFAHLPSLTANRGEPRKVFSAPKTR